MSAYTQDKVWSSWEAHYKSLAMVDTWGHLFPEGIYYEGYVRISKSIYSQGHGVMDEKIEISSSPWWFDAITDFSYKVQEDMEAGEIADFKISVTVESVLEEYPWYMEDDEEEQKDYERKILKQLNIVTMEKIILAPAW